MGSFTAQRFRRKSRDNVSLRTDLSMSCLVVIDLQGVLLLVESKDRLEVVAASLCFEVEYRFEGEDISIAVSRRQHALILPCISFYFLFQLSMPFQFRLLNVEKCVV